MSELLFLAHRIPYPPDKGDKIRSYHLLKALAAEHTVHVGTFVDDPADWAHVEAVQRLCKGETCLRPLNPKWSRLRSATGFLNGSPLTLAYYRDRTLARWIRDLSQRRPLAGVFAFSSSMGQYAEQAGLPAGAPRVMDFCDVDSDKWRQYAANHGQPLKLVYAREARRLAQLERRYQRRFDATLVISAAEARVLREATGEASDRVKVVPNGVDTDYFDPAATYADPLPGHTPKVVFTGAMDYHANVDGVRWFAQDVLPAIRRARPGATFVVVGSNPSPEVRALAVEPGVIVTGRVPDVRPYLAHATVVVAPLRIARGVQNKVLEALAMARPVVATDNALQGIPAAVEAGVAVANDPASIVQAVIGRLGSHIDGSTGRHFVQSRFGWAAQLQAVASLFRHGSDASTGMESLGTAVA